MRLKKTGATILAVAMLIPALFLSACDQSENDLQLADLTPEEHTYIERIVVLERAKSVALNDRTLGGAILDSLSLAWGDSIEARTAALAPVDPVRSVAVHDLLKRIIMAEKDSLLLAPSPRRLAVPLQDPPVEAPPAKEPETEEKL
jgi:hypothetical protein